MCHLRHRLRIFLFSRKVMFGSQDIQVFVFLTIPWFAKSVTSWQVLVHQTVPIRTIYFLNNNSWSHRTWPIDRLPVQQFSGIFWTLWRTGANFLVLFSLATCSSYSIISYVNVPVFHFLKVNKGQLKLVNVNY